MEEKLVIIDFGSQYTQLIARKVRELQVYAEIHPYHHLPPLDASVKGIILSGSPCSVRDPGAPTIQIDKFPPQIPVLGICYGAQLMAHLGGGHVSKSDSREYGRAHLETLTDNRLLQGISPRSQVWMSHGDTIGLLPQNFKPIASTADVANAAFHIEGRHAWGIQFHPEVHHTEQGKTLLDNFLDICGFSKDWTAAQFVQETIDQIQKTVGLDYVVMGLSGGVDSTVAAELIHQAIGPRLTCLFVDNGLLRKNEFHDVLESYKLMGLNVIGIDARQEFLQALAGLTEPEAKRKAVGKVFVDVFQRAAGNIKGAAWLGQGTIYPDVIESLSVKGPSVTIKSHHNVGGLPEKMHLKVLEPLRLLFKDEVRQVGAQLGIPSQILQRHPFPGPGLSIRILGEVNTQKVALLQEADAIFIEHLKKSGWYDKTWQAATILLPIHSVGVMGDERTYEQVVALRAVSSVDGMTADWVHLPHELLAKVSSDIINKVRGINRVVYDVSSKPPATIEWE
ncbi:MAG: glutamine-hydrolyzing GMP synthase [Bacteroidetes bacterium]|nr:glutamine-hydrolyzing GMP synthase [Bacteroidota bacterium]